jgi:hypothetical protein
MVKGNVENGRAEEGRVMPATGWEYLGGKRRAGKGRRKEGRGCGGRKYCIVAWRQLERKTMTAWRGMTKVKRVRIFNGKWWELEEEEWCRWLGGWELGGEGGGRMAKWVGILKGRKA